MIHVIHTIDAFTATSGGTSTCTYDLLCALNARPDVQAQILVTQPKTPLMGRGEDWIRTVENDEKTLFGISSNLRRGLEQSSADIYHTNGLWRYCNHVTAVVARQKGKPFVITPHGMLYPQALERSKWQKKLFSRLLFDRDLREAACIHVTCEEEMEVVRRLGYTNPVAVIGNPVRMPKRTETVKTERVRFGYLGRLHPRKQVELLIEALSLLSADEQARCELDIMGIGERNYEQYLRGLAIQAKLGNVRFAGFVEGEEKERELAALSALFVPSDFENFGMIITEALSCGTPVWASTGTPWRTLQDQQCGWWQEAKVENIVAAMREIIGMPPERLETMGAVGRQFVQAHFAAESVAQQMEELYQWIATKQTKPAFVYE